MKTYVNRCGFFGAVALFSILFARGALATKIYMHYMPWFETPHTLGPGRWGWHWTMNNQDPNAIEPNGQRQIASHYYPKIGPYDSRDPDVIEYHLLLMKLSGVDGVLIDWYGVEGKNGDIDSLLESSNAFIARVGDFGLEFAVVLEEKFSANVDQAKANVAYLRENYFKNPHYIRDDSTDRPLLLVFGPITFKNPSQWTEILWEAGEEVDFLTLAFASPDAGSNADGEYAWPFANQGDGSDHLDVLNHFCSSRVPLLAVAGGVAYPGFDDFYVEGGVGNIVPFKIPHLEGETLRQTFSLWRDDIHFLQLATFNDFGEGTMFEPTVETGYDYLVELQEFSGTPYREEELDLVHALYLARKDPANEGTAQGTLDTVASLLRGLKIDEARNLLLGNCSPCPEVPFLRGDSDADGSLTVGDAILSLGFQFLGTANPPCLDALDFNDDGGIDTTDPISNLSHQFLGHAPPETPGKDSCGPDPTQDNLSCESYPEANCQ